MICKEWCMEMTKFRNFSENFMAFPEGFDCIWYIFENRFEMTAIFAWGNELILLCGVSNVPWKLVSTMPAYVLTFLLLSNI